MGSRFVEGTPATDDPVNSAPLRDDLDALYLAKIKPLLVQQQPSPGMTVNVVADQGRAYFGSDPLDYPGGNSPTFSAPSGSDERIDLLLMDSAGTLSIVQGTAVTPPTVPFAPAYPTTKLPLAEIYLRGGMSSIKNDDDSTNGYILSLRTPIIAPQLSLGYQKLLVAQNLNVVFDESDDEVDLMTAVTVEASLLGNPGDVLRIRLLGSLDRDTLIGDASIDFNLRLRMDGVLQATSVVDVSGPSNDITGEFPITIDYWIQRVDATHIRHWMRYDGYSFELELKHATNGGGFTSGGQLLSTVSLNNAVAVKITGEISATTDTDFKLKVFSASAWVERAIL